jgi:hypothetical protein
MVRPVDGDLQRLAGMAGVEVKRPLGRSGLGAIGVPDGQEAAAFVAGLQDAGLIEAGRPMGRTFGAGLAQIEALQFGHVRSQVPSTAPASLSEVVVAVLDTGIAYEDFVDVDGTEYRRAPTLASSPVHAPYDFVNGDAHANDDHQHGTHIASVIASKGAVDGVAPGVGLMPVKVLGADNTGNELDLVEGLYHATDHGADVVNLSLSFDGGYVPSRALLAAIDYARDRGVTLVGAAGNAAMDEVSWPAASPRVMAVGAYCMKSNTGVMHAPYSNRGPAVDLNAPGGCLDRDVYKKEGIPDGIVGETIARNQPGELGYWLMAGTSQAAAYVSGTVARMVAEGAPVERADRFMQKTASKWTGHGGFAEGGGGGRLRVDAALSQSRNDFTMAWKREGRIDLSLMPHLIDNGDGTVTPAARVTALDFEGKRADATWVYGRLYGEGGGSVSCKVLRRNDGVCTLLGSPVPATDASGQPRALAWRFDLGAAVRGDNIAFRPRAMLFASDTLEALAGELQSDPELADAALAFHWSSEDSSGLGELSDAYVVMDSGSGISTSPFGLIVTPPALGDLGDVTPGELDGSGISTSPFGIRVITVPPYNPVDGSGISTSPFGFKLVSFEAGDLLGGSGISTSPFGFKELASPPPGVCVDGCEVFDQEPLLLGESVIASPEGLDFEGTALRLQLDGGGWQTDDGVGAATALTGSVDLKVQATAIGESVGTGAVEIVLD